MNITVFGAGNLGLACCAVLSQDNDVTLYTTRPHKSRETLAYTYEEKAVASATFTVTDDMARACNAELILCTYPAFLRQQFVADVEPYVGKGTLIGFVPGYGGVEYYCQGLITRGVTVFGLQRVPYVCRSSWDERTAGILVLAKETLYVATLPKGRTAEVAALLEDLFHIPTVALKEFLAVTLVPSNPLLHTSGAYGVFKDYQPGDTYPEQLMFYEQWNDDTSRFLLAYDDELQAVCRALAPLDLSEVVSLREYYESPIPGHDSQAEEHPGLRGGQGTPEPHRGRHIPAELERPHVHRGLPLRRGHHQGHRLHGRRANAYHRHPPRFLSRANWH